MTIKVTILLLFSGIPAIAFGQADGLNKKQTQAILKLVGFFKQGDKAKIAASISYPLRRAYPLKDVKNKNDFIQRFDDIFDKEFMHHISKSGIKNWTAAGWRGIMFDDGTVWVDDDGKIQSVNYQSAKEQQLLKSAIQDNKSRLPKRLQNFKDPVYLIITKSYRIRIDRMPDGAYRYAAWKKKDSKAEPGIVIENGVLDAEGNGGNHTITFKNEDYTYVIAINVIGTADDAAAVLTVLKQEQEILTENGDIKRN